MNLTLRQQQVLALIRRQIEVSGFPPTRSEIARSLGFRSANAAEQHLRALEKKGAIEILRGTSRGIRLLEGEAIQEAGLPVVGRVAAGHPILAEEHIEERYELDQKLFRARADYLLRVRGMSMRDAGIYENDLLAVHATPYAENGQIVVARIEEEVTVKRFKRDGRHEYLVSLLPENPDFMPIELDLRKQQLTIEGIAVGLLRNFSPLGL